MFGRVLSKKREQKKKIYLVINFVFQQTLTRCLNVAGLFYAMRILTYYYCSNDGWSSIKEETKK